jgi:hypothetical protein
MAQIYLELVDCKQPDGKTITFRKPGAIGDCRWMQHTLYMGKIFLLSAQLNIDADLLKQIHRYLRFQIIYGQCWLTATIAKDAPFRDLTFLKKAYEYKSLDKELATVCINAIERHSSYLSGQSAFLSLVSSLVTDEEKRKIADAIIGVLPQSGGQ